MVTFLFCIKADLRKTPRVLPCCFPASCPHMHRGSFSVRRKRGKEPSDCPRLCSGSLEGSSVIPDSLFCAFFQTTLLPSLGEHFQTAGQNADSVFRIIFNCQLGHKYFNHYKKRLIKCATYRNSLEK